MHCCVCWTEVRCHCLSNHYQGFSVSKLHLFVYLYNSDIPKHKTCFVTKVTNNYKSVYYTSYAREGLTKVVSKHCQVLRVHKSGDTITLYCTNVYSHFKVKRTKYVFELSKEVSFFSKHSMLITTLACRG